MRVSFSLQLRIILFSLLIQSGLVSKVLSQRREDVLYLSNGSVIHGTVLNDSTSHNIRVLSRTGDILAFDPAEVDSIRSEKTTEFRAMQFNRRGFDFGGNAELLMRSGNSSIGKTAVPGVNLSLDYRFNPLLSTGAEMGIEFYDWMEMPFTVCLRMRSSRGVISPFLLLRTGYTVPLEKRQNDWDYEYKSYGGIHTTLGAGLEKIINQNTAFLISISWHYQELNYHLTPLHQWVQERDRKESYSRLRLAVGYVFK